MRWIIDPLDGTTDFFASTSLFGCSIAVEVDGPRPNFEVLVSDSVGKATYAAVTDHGATCGGDRSRLGHRRRPCWRPRLHRVFPIHAEQRRLQGAGAHAQVIERIADIRRSGAAALDLCLLAAGSVDAFFELDLAPGTTQPGASFATAAACSGRLHLPGAHGQGPAVAAAHPGILAPLTELLYRRVA